MVIIRDENRVARLKKVSQWVSLIGFLALITGLILIFTHTDDPNLFMYQVFALSTGWLLSQVGSYLAHRYVRKPRPDEVLDEAFKRAARDGRLYHHIIPGAPHVLLQPEGVIVINAKFQSGGISVDENGRWRQTGIGLRKYFGQEGLGNPTQETESMVKAVARYLSKNAPEVEETLIAPMIVFTTKDIKSLNVAKSSIPAMHAQKVRGFLKNKAGRAPLPPKDYDAIRAALDNAAGDLVAQPAN
jgi:hypothetical protein